MELQKENYNKKKKTNEKIFQINFLLFSGSLFSVCWS